MQTVHPSPEAVRLAMARIRRAVDAHGGDCESPMDWGIVRRDGCRTIACHGGWYALGRLMDHAAVSWRRDADFPPDDAGETLMAARPDGSVSPVMHFEGGHALARDLGFMNAPALKGWAERHPELWGNRHGERMFAGDGAIAFGRPAYSPIRVSEIVDWWLAVADRLDAAIPVHRNRADALAALARHDPSALPGIGIEPCANGWRPVRRPRPDSLLPVSASESGAGGCKPGEEGRPGHGHVRAPLCFLRHGFERRSGHPHPAVGCRPLGPGTRSGAALPAGPRR